MSAAPNPHTNANLAAALGYARLGWRVIPIPPGRKHPGIAAWQTAGTTDAERIEHWWTNAPDHGIGIVTGEASGLWVLDVDVSDGKAGDETLAELEAAYGALPDTWEVVTGSGGRHLYFAWPTGGQVIRNSASGALGPGLDVRGEGGQVLAPPTIHPNGRAYELEASSPDHLAQAPGWLLALLDDTDEPATPRATTPERTDRPGDQWAAATSWDELLERDGWSKLRPGPGGEERWTRPGKDRREGPSATVGFGGSDVLKVFTSSLTHLGLRPDETYTKLGYIAATRHGGDFASAAAALRDAGYGDPAQAWDVRDLIGDGASAVAATPTAADDPWPEPEPIPEAPEPPPFPLPVLPGWCVDHVAATAEALQVPVDLCAMLTIGALAAAATGRAEVRVNSGWTEPLNLYLVVAMRSGAGKSPAEKACVGWLRRFERDRMATFRPAHDEAEILARLAEKRYRKAADSALADDHEVLAAAAKATQARADVPALPRLIIDDTTPEAVATLLAAHGERLAILSTEADLFDMLLRGNPGQRASVNVYLKAWSGDELRRDRKGGSESGPETTVLTRPLLSVSVTVQPAVLARLLTDTEMTSRGFASRFMASMPTDLMGQRDQRRRFAGADATLAQAFEARATELAGRWATWATPGTLDLAPEAVERLQAWLVDLEPHLAADGELGRIAEWVAKLQGSVVRYAGLLHLSEGHGTSKAIALDTMERAIELGHYWLGHAVALAGSALPRHVEQAQAILDWIHDGNHATFTTATLLRGLRRPGIGLDRAEDYIAPIAWLEEHFYLRAVDNADWRSAVGVKRSAKPTLQVSPAVMAESLGVSYARSARIPLRESSNSLSSYIPPYPLGGHAPRALRAQREEPHPEVAVDIPAEADPDPLDPVAWGAEPTPETPTEETHEP